MQARIGHAHIGKYYRDFNILEDISCPCSAITQTCIHILSECPLFDKHRHLLQDKEQNIIPTDLLGTKEGIECFTEFLKRTHSSQPRIIPIPTHYPTYLSYKIQHNTPHTDYNTPHHANPLIKTPLLNPMSPCISRETPTPITPLDTPKYSPAIPGPGMCLSYRLEI
jgi:hypothetical protein